MSEIKKHPHELVRLSWLKAAEYNPRAMPDAEMEKLSRSLREFGFVEPVVARAEDGLIIGGHQRVEAYRRILSEAGGSEDGATVPAILLSGVSDDRAKLLNLALNKVHGDWDEAKLADVFASLEGLGAEVVDLSGFSSAEVGELLAEMGRAEAPAPDAPADAEADADAAKDAKARSRRFSFEVSTDKEAEFCRRVLKRFGMDGPATGSGAFVKALRASVRRKGAKVKEEAAATAADDRS